MFFCMWKDTCGVEVYYFGKGETPEEALTFLRCQADDYTITAEDCTWYHGKEITVKTVLLVE